jgi:Tol biopolymer transport system component
MRTIRGLTVLTMVVGLLVGCGRGSQPTASPPKLVATETQVPVTTPISTQAVAPVSSPTKTKTPVPSETPAPTVTFTPTASPTLPPPQGSLLEFINQVDAHPLPGGAWEQALVNMALYAGGEVWAKESSTALIGLESDLVRVAPNTIFTLSKPDADTLQLNLQEGQVWINIEGLDAGEQFQVETPSAVASIRGTRFSVRAEPGGVTVVSSMVSTVTVTTSAGAVDVGTGQQTDVQPGRAPSQPVEMSYEEKLRWEMAVGPNLGIGIPVVDVTNVITLTAMTGEANWSHDGEKFTFFSYDPRVDVSSHSVFYDVGETMPVTMTIPIMDAHGFVYNPAGEGLAYIQDSSPGSQICTAQQDGSNPTCFGEGGYYSSLTWSPDGQWLLFVGQENNLFKAKPDGSQWAQLTNQSGTCSFASWSHDGTKIAYFYYFNWSLPLKGDVWLMNADGSDPRKIFEGAYWAPQWGGALPWSTDDKWLAVSSATGLWIFSPDGATSQQVPETEAQTYHDIAWSPSSTGWPLIFAYTDEFGGDTVMMYVSGEGNPPRAFPAASWGPVWSPDGKRVAWAYMTGSSSNYQTIMYFFQVEPDFWP